LLRLEGLLGHLLEDLRNPEARKVSKSGVLQWKGGVGSYLRPRRSFFFAGGIQLE
jgi:hypothetical protein